jgi:hypothetical protein
MKLGAEKFAALILLHLACAALTAAQQNTNCNGSTKLCSPPQTQNAAPVPAPQNATIWSIPPSQRQALLADEIRQAQQTQQVTTELRSQINAAYASQQQAQQAAQQAAVSEVAAQQQAAQSIQAASQAAMQAGYAKAAGEAEARAIPKRVDMVVAVAKDWTPPKQYSAANSPAVVLDDPFSAVAKPDPLAPLRASLKETCLMLDDEHEVARVDKNCLSSGEKLPFQVGDYPVLADGSLVDSPDKVKAFLEMCANHQSPLYTLRNESEMVVLRR